MKLFLFLFIAYVFPAKIINGTAATVGKTLITFDDAHFYEALQKFWYGEKPSPPSENERLARIVQRMMLGEMVIREMENAVTSPQAKIEIEKKIKVLRKKPETGKRWQEILKRYGKTETAAVENLAKSFEVEKFVQKKAETLTPIVTDTDAERYFKQNQAKFSGKDLESMKPKIIWIIKQEKMRKGFEDWVRFLKEKYKASLLLEGS